MKKTILLLFFLPQLLWAQVTVVKQPTAVKGGFPLATKSSLAQICVDPDDFEAVKKSAALFAADMERVTGRLPEVVASTTAPGRNVVIIGTLGESHLIDQLVAAKKLTADSLKGQWERYLVQTIDKPFPHIDKALVIAGSDRRGTAYGVFSLSEAIGVSPWYWWADVPVKKSATLFLPPVAWLSRPPDVKYRGIFLNDEDWGLLPWAAKNYEQTLGDIGPGTYERICELLLRLKGNMLAPAMHSATGAFYSHPHSKAVADAYGIMITTSHCEPLLFNNAAKSEWDNQRDGEWNYATNKEVILKKLDDRVREAAPYENLYTVGMRGLHDEGMRGNLSKSEQVQILARVISDQRDILQKYLQKPPTDIAQVFVPYKETLDLYERGLQVPDDVTLVWPDDNYGYIKRLSNPQEQKRSGGSGVYYHTSYLGAPHDYLWLCTTPPVLMYEELKKAYNTGANRYWLLNVGDIKPAEMGIQTFFDLAWNVEGFDFQKINRHQGRFLGSIFGRSYEQTFQDILDTYYRLAWSRKPEFMGWEREWDAPEFRELAPTRFSFRHYNDAQQRLADYRRIALLAEGIFKKLPEQQRPAFFELLGYPVIGSFEMNRKFLMAQLNGEQVRDGNLAVANWAAGQAKAAYERIDSLTQVYNALLGGKWKGMMKLAPGWVAKYQHMPAVVYTEGAGEKPADLAPEREKRRLEGCTVLNLRHFKNKVAAQGHTLRLVEGIGYDGNVLQLGEATEATADPGDLRGSRYEYEFSGVTADSVTVQVYTVPFFPLYEGRSTRFGISVDGQPAFVAKNDPKEFTKPWKDQVLQNGAVAQARFPVNKAAQKHMLALTCGDPGVMIQRIVIDWGGLQPTYTGPSVTP
ncbi:glycosyl hydrolase 115 family protein [Paraflavisolibacter sp. H34]|uniref:glycosyl hydrolase 115 family protein n=1 Tax=Huijunlia imazamoxiresistens TaxID=3127457 RepID=UPI00301661FF